MPEKLLTLQELSAYLSVREEKLTLLVEEGVIPGYHIAGQFLRFRKDQIDAIKSEIDARVEVGERISDDNTRLNIREHRSKVAGGVVDSAGDRVSDFIYFYDFYMISAIIIAFLLFIILK